MAASERAIYDKTVDIYKLFQRYQQDGRARNKNLAEDVYKRWELWDSYAGAGDNTRASHRLDQRLQGSEEIHAVRTAFIRLLELVHENLNSIIQKPENEVIVSSLSLAKFQDPELDESTLSMVKTIKLLGKEWGEIVVALNDMLGLMRTVRRAIAQHPERGIHYNRDDDVYFRDLCRAYIRWQFPRTRGTMAELLGDSLHLRRRRLLYERSRHHSRCGRQKNHPQQTTNVPNTQSQPQDARHSRRLGQEVDSTKTRRPQVAQSTQVSRPTPSLMREPRRRRTVASVKFAGTAIGDENLAYPVRPEKRCSYCFDVFNQPPSQNEWQAHIEDDLRIFYCLAEQCELSSRFFASKKEWRQHMVLSHGLDWPQQIHQAAWACDSGHDEIFVSNNALACRIHLEEMHPEFQKLSERMKIAHIRRKRVVSPRDPGVCPICEELVFESKGEPRTEDRVADHVSRHLCRIAFISLPATDAEDQENREQMNGPAAPVSDASESTRSFELPSRADSLQDVSSNGSDNLDLSEHLHSDSGFFEKMVANEETHSLLAKVRDRHPQDPNDEVLAHFHDQQIQRLPEAERDAQWRLWADLREAREESIWCRKPFVPENQFAALVTPDTIRACLPLAHEDLIGYVIEESSRIFAILVSIRAEEPVHELMADLKLLKIADPQLPLARSYGADSSMLLLDHWPDTLREDFFNRQWEFLAPVFDSQHFRLECAPHDILPFIQVERHSSIDYFGETKRAVIHHAHHRGFSTDGEHLCIAIKEFKAQRPLSASIVNPADVAKEAFEQEVKALESSPPHKHLIQRVAALVVDGKYLLLSMWADGDLERFWHEQPRPKLTVTFVREVLVQLLGLAQAIESFQTQPRRSERRNSGHPSATTDSNSNASGNPTLNLDGMALEDDAEVYWRYGDLKPSNILRCKDDTFLGVLKIGDLGLAKRHTEATGQRRIPTAAKYWNTEYEPPEATLALSRPRSRLYDIWSFGCIMLEMVVWMLYGNEDWQAFKSQEMSAVTQGAFYDTNGRRSRLRPSISDLINSILEYDSECTRRQPSAIRDLLHLIQQDLLVAQESRLRAKKLVERLAQILENYQELGDLYLFSGLPRSPSKLPEPLSKGLLQVQGGAGKSRYIPGHKDVSPTV